MVQRAVCQSAKRKKTFNYTHTTYGNVLYIFFLIVAEDCFIGIENYAPALILWPCEIFFHFFS